MVNKKIILGFLVVLSIFIFSCTNQNDVDNGVAMDTPNISSPDNDVIDDVNDNDGVDDDNGVDDVDVIDDNDDVDVIDDNNDGVDDVVSGEVKTFYVEAGPDFAFYIDGERNADMVVNVGDTVRVEFVAVDRLPHDWRVDEFRNAASAILSEGGSEVIEFVVDKPGTFEYYCSVGLHKEYGMVGRFIVEE
jgi:plastocyanin